MIINLDTPSSEQQLNFGVLQIDIENSATGVPELQNLSLLNSNIRSVFTATHHFEIRIILRDSAEIQTNSDVFFFLHFS